MSVLYYKYIKKIIVSVKNIKNMNIFKIVRI